MAIYTVQGPDGQQHQIEGPDGASDDEIIAGAQQAFGQQAAQPSAPEPSQGVGDTIMAGLRGAASGATFGMSDRASAALASGMSRILPGAKPLTYSEARARITGMDDASPVAHLAGELTGGLLTGGAVARAGAAAASRIAPGAVRAGRELLTLRKGKSVGTIAANTARMSGQGAVAGAAYGTVAGALQGGVDSAAEGDNPIAGAVEGAIEGGGLGAAGGAVAGPVVGGLVQGVNSALRTFAPQSQRAIRLLSKTLSMEPRQLADALRTAQRGGVASPVAAVVEARDIGNLTPVVNKFQSSAARMSAAADADLAAAPSRTSAAVEQAGTTQTPFAQHPTARTARAAPLYEARDTAMNDAMGPRDTTGVRMPGSLGTEHVADAATMHAFNLRQDIVDARREVPGLNSLLNRELSQETDYTVDNFDRLRQSLGRLQSSLAKSNSQYADTVRRVRDELVDFARQNQRYAAALDDYTAHSQFIKGFEHAYEGKAPTAVTDLLDRADLASEFGRNGMELGARSRIYDLVNSSESGAVRGANLMRQRVDTPATEVLRPTEVARQRRIGEAETRRYRNFSALSSRRVGSKQEEDASALQQAAEVTVAAGGHALTGFKVHAISRFLSSLGVRESDANGVVDLITTANRTELRRLPALLRKANIDAAAQRRILMAAAARSSNGVAAVLNSVSQENK